MKLGFASDHRGYLLKEKLIEYFKNNYEIVDCGTDNEKSCDYPVYAYKLGELIKNGKVDYGIAICGSGIGINIALNKIKGVYCAKVSNIEEALHTRLDNDTNCVSFGESMPYENAVKIIETFIKTDFSNLDKHKRRLNILKSIEDGTYHG